MEGDYRTRVPSQHSIEQMVQNAHEWVTWKANRKLPTKTEFLTPMEKHESTTPRDLTINLKVIYRLTL